MRRSPLPILVASMAALHAAGSLARAGDPPIDFPRDIRPILASNCFKCHGPDEEARQGGLRLDTREGATQAREPSKRTGEARGPAITPGDAAASLLIRRITDPDPKRRMPPPEVNAHGLAPEQIATLRRWIDGGAKWGDHWSFAPVTAPPPPAVKDQAWCRTEWDRFVLAKLDAAGVKPAVPASKETLLRRVSLDLTGLPPTPEQSNAFLTDARPDAYERLVDSLLASPRFGEKWARWWLDLARYADTKGYEKDERRTMWPYRDWVIRAFNADLPLDQFTIEQLAGDLVKSPTQEQLIATGFHRNTMTNDEGGTDDEEFRTAAVIDRVNTTMEVWQGLTFACAQCHTHKFDPVTHTDYYRLMAVFNNTQDNDQPDERPTLAIVKPEHLGELAAIEKQIEEADRRLAQHAAELARAWPPPNTPRLAPQGFMPVIDDALPGAVSVYRGENTGLWPWYAAKAGDKVKPDSGERCWKVIARKPTQTFAFDIAPAIKVEAGESLSVRVRFEGDNAPKALMMEWTSAEDGWEHRAYWGDGSALPWAKDVDGTAKRRRIGDLPKPDEWATLSVPAAAVNLEGHAVKSWAFTQDRGTVYWDRAGIETHRPLDDGAWRNFDAWAALEKARGAPTAIGETKGILSKDASQWTPAERDRAREYFVRNVSPITVAMLAADETLAAMLRAQRDDLTADTVSVPILRENPAAERRVSRRFVRGSFRNPAEEVKPGVPEFLSNGATSEVSDRLQLAQWLVSDANPLTSRVLANRIWEQVFGRGVCETVEDVGTQGAWPDNRELLDALAISLRSKHAWSLKAFLKEVVSSATYRQSSAATAEMLARDPDNRLLARFPRVRLDGETIRDQALAAAGLLSPKMYGPSVFPHQPDGVWMMIYSSDAWRQSEGEDAHRRSLYTFWRRTSPHPAMTTFDAPSREFCVSRRVRTNTPLQAFVTLNDPQFVECARALGARAAGFAGDDAAKLGFAFQLLLARRPGSEEQAVILKLLASQRQAAGDAAAWERVAAVLLNLDESLMRE